MPTADELYDRAVAQRDGGDKAAAVDTLKDAVADSPDHSLSHGLLARLCADLGRSDEAIEHAKRVAELEPEDAFSFTALSVIYQRCGRIPEAEDALARARSMNMGF